MTDQEVFDTVAKHLLTQGRKSLAGGKCAYRGNGGRMCAVGVVLPNKLYKEMYEGKDVNYLLEMDYRIDQLLGQNTTLLNDLQRLHDEEPARSWKKALLALAELRGLDPTAVLAFKKEV